MADNELKVTIILKEDRIFLGAQRTDCDPKMRVAQGDLAAALAIIPEFVAQSNTEWDAAPRNPKSTIEPPAPPAPAPRPVASKPARSKPAEPVEKAAPAGQPRFF